MNERPTPETDGIEFHAMAGMMPPYNTVPADFARRLERERDEAREQTEKMREAIREAHAALGQLDNCRIFCADSMDIDNYATDDCDTARAKLQPFLT
jgi:hypothetical protein